MDCAATSLLATLVLSLLQQGLAIQCYICSWSPKDANNRTDSCTEEKFNFRNVYIHECPDGCETYIQWDTNGVLEHWRRNCASPNSKGILMSEGCKSASTLVAQSTTCSCTSDFCNSATWTVPTSAWQLTSAVAAALCVGRVAFL